MYVWFCVVWCVVWFHVVWCVAVCSMVVSVHVRVVLQCAVWLLVCMCARVCVCDKIEKIEMGGARSMKGG